MTRKTIAAEAFLCVLLAAVFVVVTWEGLHARPPAKIEQKLVCQGKAFHACVVTLVEQEGAYGATVTCSKIEGVGRRSYCNVDLGSQQCYDLIVAQDDKGIPSPQSPPSQRPIC